jgi:hypothetical protein
MTKDRIDLYCDLLRKGLVDIRAMTNVGDTKLISHMADHLHNIPNIIKTQSDGAENYYWDIDRPQFIANMPPERLGEYEKIWSKMSEVK